MALVWQASVTQTPLFNGALFFREPLGYCHSAHGGHSRADVALSRASRVLFKSRGRFQSPFTFPTFPSDYKLANETLQFPAPRRHTRQEFHYEANEGELPRVRVANFPLAASIIRAVIKTLARHGCGMLLRGCAGSSTSVFSFRVRDCILAERYMRRAHPLLGRRY